MLIWASNVSSTLTLGRGQEILGSDGSGTDDTKFVGGESFGKLGEIGVTGGLRVELRLDGTLEGRNLCRHANENK